MIIVLECHAIDILLSTNIDYRKVLPGASASIEGLFLTFPRGSCRLLEAHSNPMWQSSFAIRKEGP
jgi:hypothetical protein